MLRAKSYHSSLDMNVNMVHVIEVCILQCSFRVKALPVNDNVHFLIFGEGVLDLECSGEIRNTCAL